VSSQRASTARARLVSTITQEILSRDEQSTFPISSEHQLCRRFNVSRVTVRLALSDLENRGLIYRKHGKGTFAHGRATRVHRYLGILMKTPLSAGHRPISEMMRGVQTVMASLRSAILVINTPPEIWQPEKASSLGGVIVVPTDITSKDLDVLRDRNLPYLLFTESDLAGPTVSVGQKKAAKHLTEQLLSQGHRRLAIISGYDTCLDASKRKGVHEALREAGIDPAQVPEFSAHNDEGSIRDAACSILHMSPRPTAVIAFDDSLASVVSFFARRQEGLHVPNDLSLVSFHAWPFLNFNDMTLHSAKFEFFTAGQKAAEALTSAALTGDPVTDITLEPSYRTGNSVGPVPTT
jgi:GntR family transcriptional regulator, arabinose operon transcriptional repressor